MALKSLSPADHLGAPSRLRHLMATFYDFLLCIALVMVITLAYQQGVLRLIYGAETLQAMSEAGALDQDAGLSLLILLSLFGFFGLFWTLKGQTLGMQVWRLRVQQPNGLSITWRQALIRFLVAIPAWLCGGLGVLWAWWDKDSRTWQDMASNTRLVELPKPAKGR
jgi:uncharacterized RDD family membrane protein YckC